MRTNVVQPGRTSRRGTDTRYPLVQYDLLEQVLNVVPLPRTACPPTFAPAVLLAVHQHGLCQRHDDDVDGGSYLLAAET